MCLVSQTDANLENYPQSWGKVGGEVVAMNEKYDPLKIPIWLCADHSKQLINTGWTWCGDTYSVGHDGLLCSGAECQNLPAWAPAGHPSGDFQTPFPRGHQQWAAVGTRLEMVTPRASIDLDPIWGWGGSLIEEKDSNTIQI